MDIVLVGHTTKSTRRATTATIPGVIRYLAWSSTRMGTYTHILQYCLCQGYNRISNQGRFFNDCYRGYLVSDMHDQR